MSTNDRNIELTKLDGYNELDGGTYNITIKAVSPNYITSEFSTAVQITKHGSADFTVATTTIKDDGKAYITNVISGKYYTAWDNEKGGLGTLFTKVATDNNDINLGRGTTGSYGGVINDSGTVPLYACVGDKFATKEEIISYEAGEYPYDNWICFIENTLITLADGSTKAVQDINYNDDILGWDFDNGKQASAKPCWIAKPGVASNYWKITLSDGTILGLVGAHGKSHRLFNSRGEFVYPQDFEANEQTVKQDNTTAYIIGCEKIFETVKYYNFATNYLLNNYANGVLCGSRFSNIYPIESMKYVKDNRTLATREEYAEIPDILFYGLRIAEQQNLDDNLANVNYYHTMKEHVLHNYIEHERDYVGKADYEPWLFKSNKNLR